MASVMAHSVKEQLNAGAWVLSAPAQFEHTISKGAIVASLSLSFAQPHLNALYRMTAAVFPSLMEIGARDPATHEVFSRGESIGLAFDTLAGLASALAAACVLMLIFYRIYVSGWELEPFDSSVAALFVAEFIQGISHFMDLKWVIEGTAETGAFCTAQGLLQQLGETSVALATLTIAVQTFLAIWRLTEPNRTISAIAIGVEFLFVILFVAIGFGIHTHPTKEYYAIPDPYWCWIGNRYQGERLGGEYIWLWVTLFFSFALYPPLFLLHFNIIHPGTSWYLPAQPSTGADARPRDGKLWCTILYPILYCVLVLPLSVVRWITFTTTATSSPLSQPVATLVVAVVFSLSGILNALLYALTRSRIFRPDARPPPPPPRMREAPESAIS
jgi:hypothetical protein